jgi:hypothetical protein
MLAKPMTLRCLACGVPILPAEGLWIERPDGSALMTSYSGLEQLLDHDLELARVLHVRCAKPARRSADLTPARWHRARRRAA